MKTTSIIRELRIPILLSLLGVLLLVGRFLYTHELRFVFLIWNLILAVIPFIISKWALQIKPNTLSYALVFASWMLFLPNAPYIITDFIHLKFSSNATFLLDFALIGVFALAGLMLATLSIQHILESLQTKISPAGSWLIIIGVIGLSGIGIYLGRFIRWNSWDIINSPHLILGDIWLMFRHPSAHVFAWKFSFGISMLIFAFQLMYQIVIHHVKKKRAFFNY